MATPLATNFRSTKINNFRRTVFLRFVPTSPHRRHLSYSIAYIATWCSLTTYVFSTGRRMWSSPTAHTISPSCAIRLRHTNWDASSPKAVEKTGASTVSQENGNHNPTILYRKNNTVRSVVWGTEGHLNTPGRLPSTHVYCEASPLHLRDPSSLDRQASTQRSLYRTSRRSEKHCSSSQTFPPKTVLTKSDLKSWQVG